MKVTGNDIGMIGLGVMGSNLALNMADHGFSVAAYNRTEAVTREFAAQLRPEQNVRAYYTLDELVASLARPRRVMIMVKAGGPVDAVIGGLETLLDPEDIVIDGGNSHFTDTERRGRSLATKGLHFLGVGISGGEAGARRGPSMMPGGPEEAYQAVRPIFEAIAAQADGGPCVAYLGPGAAGHYVKMVHNGIEYGLMQLIAESYALMKEVLGLSNEELAEVYAEWNEAELDSYLVEITSAIFKRRDVPTGFYLIDLIRGEAEQLGTGMWTSQSAMDLRVPIPNIDIAVSMRNLSALDEERRQASMALAGPGEWGGEGPSQPTSGGRALGGYAGAGRAQESHPPTVDTVRNALFAGMVITYAQGFALLRTASDALGYALHLADVASVWRGGCIIRSALLRQIKTVFEQSEGTPSLLLDREAAGLVAERRDDLVGAIEAGISKGVAVPGLMTALAYLDAYRVQWLPSNLIQAQRDYFGAHGYRRLDKEGTFHTDWLVEEGAE